MKRLHIKDAIIQNLREAEIILMYRTIDYWQKATMEDFQMRLKKLENFSHYHAPSKPYEDSEHCQGGVCYRG